MNKIIEQGMEKISINGVMINFAWKLIRTNPTAVTLMVETVANGIRLNDDSADEALKAFMLTDAWKELISTHELKNVFNLPFCVESINQQGEWMAVLAQTPFKIDWWQVGKGVVFVAAVGVVAAAAAAWIKE